MTTLCFATNNAHKLKEIQALLGGAFVLKTLDEIGCFEEIPETAETIEGNSLLKAQYIWDKYQINCFADDSGLEVTALGGAPGVNSAHYSGIRDYGINNALLLKNLTNFSDRSARFKTVITLIIDGQSRQFEGTVEGQIIEAPRGEEGFGYDPLFLPNGLHQTFAELTLAQKSQLSHRARAFGQLVVFLSKL